MSLGLYSTPLGRAIVYLKRIAAALDRLAPPPTRPSRHVEFSVATDADFLRRYDAATVEKEES